MRNLGTLFTTAAAVLAISVAAGVDAAEPDEAAVLATYADNAEATYEDAWLTAKDLQGAVDAFLAAPAAASQQAAKDAWLAARVPYQQTEAYRFGNARLAPEDQRERHDVVEAAHDDEPAEEGRADGDRLAGEPHHELQRQGSEGEPRQHEPGRCELA
jgi:hypothetical protein